MRVKTSQLTFLVIACLVLALDATAQEQVQPRQLTDDPAQDGFPDWSPDGRFVLFSRYGRDLTPERTGLWLMSPDGSDPHQLTTVIGEHPHWSPDGHYIVFDGDYGDSIQLVSASGGIPIRIVPESIPVVRGGQPKWSPDGSRIAFKEGPNLWVLELSTGRFEIVFTAPGMIPVPTCWSADGRDIYVRLIQPNTSESSIWRISSTGQGQRLVTPETGGTYRYADLSPDGSLLAVVWCVEDNCDLWVMPADGGPLVQITSHPEYDDGPAWSPDGTQIAFVSTRSGNFDVWTVEVDPERIRREIASLGH